EELVFARGVHRLFRNIASTMTAISGVEAFATVVVGAIGVVMITVGGRAIISGSMTLGDLVMYLVFTGLLAAPVIQIASIGTQISLVMAFNRPLSGRVLIDGKDLASLRLGDYRSYLGVVLQDNFLFDGTVAANIRFARPHATLEEIKRVSRIAHCDEFIEAME